MWEYKKYLPIIVLFCFYIWISGIIWAIGFFASLFLYCMIFYGILWVFKKNYTILSKANFQIFLWKFFQRISIFFLILIGFLWSFAYYQNEIKPAFMPVYTLTNGEKTLIFQAMSHIWSQNFYDRVRENILEAKQNNFVYYFEWVRPWTQENEQKFNDALWVQFDANLYDSMSQLYGLVAQDNSYFIWLWETTDKNIDVSLDDVIWEYESIKTEKNIQRTYEAALPISEMMIEQLSKLHPRQLSILRYMNKAMVNMIIKNNVVSDLMMENFSNQELFGVIIHKRNEVLAQEILTSQDLKIITTYGLLHFDGVLKILQNHDRKWQISKIDYIPVTK